MGVRLPPLYMGKTQSIVKLEEQFRKMQDAGPNLGSIEHMLGGAGIPSQSESSGMDASGGGPSSSAQPFKEIGWSEFQTTGLKLWSVRIGSHSDYMFGRVPLNGYWGELNNPPRGAKIEISRHVGGFTVRLRRGSTILTTAEASG